MSDSYRRAKEIFLAAAELPPEEREAYVEQAGRGDAVLIERVGALLAADRDDDTLLDGDATELIRVAKEETTTGQIGPYRLIEKIGEGGMGEVWLAEQSEPVRRKVALKLIKQGMDTKQIVARFEAERQALAMMEHPAIAKVYDAGATPQGLPYFVMEYVRGVPITDHSDRYKLTNRQRLELFRHVCDGVQHAHQKAVIHRDLKPSNVLVASHDGEARPKIIDFGVAKATAQPLTDKTMHTQLGTIIGTPEYMSPEQVDNTGQGVDTRADVYSLGVMLYELLVGALPFESQELRQGGLEGMLRKIRDEQPSTPSVRLSSLGGRKVQSAKRRSTDLSTLKRELTGDLDWITMKALEKDRTRRYGSPAELSADIERYLNDEPVLATPPSTVYRMKKFVRRHKFGVAAAATGVLLLVVFAATVSILAIRENRARADAERRQAQAERLIDFMLNDLHEGLDRIGRLDLLAGVARSSQAHFESLSDRDETPDALYQRGLTLQNIGGVLLDQGDAAAARSSQELAIALFEAAAEREPDVERWRQGLSSGRRRLGLVLTRQGESAAALASYRVALEQAQQLAAASPQEPDRRFAVAQGHHAIAALQRRIGDMEAVRQEAGMALSLLRELTASGGADWRQHLLLVDTHMLLATVYRFDDATDRALDEVGQALEITERMLDADPGNTFWPRRRAWIHSEMGTLLFIKGDLDRALEAQEQAHGAYRTLTLTDPTRIQWRQHLSMSLMMAGVIEGERGQSERALERYRESIEILQGLLAEDPSRVDWLRSLADVHQSIGILQLNLRQSSRAALSLETSIALMQRVVAVTGDDPEPRNLLSYNRMRLGDAYAQRQDSDRARELWTQVVEWLEPITAGSDSVNYRDTHAQALLRLGRVEESRPLVEALLTDGWNDPQFLEWVRRAGLPTEVP